VESRARIVAAGDAERRKLERNLHDGAQQHLVALAVKLRLAKDAIADDPGDAESMIDEIRGDVQEAIAELRSLAHGIFPPLLMSGGLAEALPAAAARAALPTQAVVDVDRFAAELEAAVYFCCLEALQNAGKHAGPEASAMVRVWEDGETVHWEVTDDGPGFDPSSQSGAGHGFTNMIATRSGCAGAGAPGWVWASSVGWWPAWPWAPPATHVVPGRRCHGRCGRVPRRTPRWASTRH
jgi:signal transduction histidine kinase